jgi:hypothetical protein
MISKPKKTRVLSLSIIEKAIDAIKDVAELDQQVYQNVSTYDLGNVLCYYEEIVKELKYVAEKRNSDLERINKLYITRERIYRILNPTIYLNAYTEKRANDAIYINANVGFIDEKGKVKNVVVFMGKSLETNMDVLRNKIENDHQFIESAKKKVIEKLLTKVDIPDINSDAQNTRRVHRLDAIPEFNKTTEAIVKIMRKRYDKLKSKETTIKRNDSDSLIVAFFDSMYKNVTKPLM